MAIQQVLSPFFMVGVILMVVALVVVYSSVNIVEEGDLQALLIFGEYRMVLEPGINFVPPFISTTYPIDPNQMMIEKDNGSVPLPEESRERVKELTGLQDEDSGIEYG